VKRDLEDLQGKLRAGVACADTVLARLKAFQTLPVEARRREEAERLKVEEKVAADAREGFEAGVRWARTATAADLHVIAAGDRADATPRERYGAQEFLKNAIRGALPTGFGSSASGNPSFVAGWLRALAEATKTTPAPRATT
jgi:hypothetical protein